MKKFTTTLTTLMLMLIAIPAFAQNDSYSHVGLGGVAFAAALCMGLAALGGTLGQSRTAAAALEGIARNPQSAPKVQTPMILALALIESLVLFSFVIAYLLQSKIG